MRRILIAGFGSIGRRHLRNIRHLLPQAEITVWRQHSPVEPGATPPEGADAVVGSEAEATASQPDAVIVSGPATTHIETATTFARLGAHLFVEKPLSHSLQGVEQLIEICERQNTVLMTGYVLRFLPALHCIRKLVHENAVGKVRSARIEVGQYLPDWRPDADYRTGVTAQQKLGGGALLELSHELDYTRWLLGDPQAVTAVARKVSDLDIDVEDVAEVVLDYGPGGPLAAVHVDLLQREAAMSCQIIGSTGTIRSDLIREEVELFTVSSGNFEKVEFTKSADGNEPYVRQFECFLQCAAEGSQPPADGRAGKRALEIVLAAKQSSEESREIRLPALRQDVDNTARRAS